MSVETTYVGGPLAQPCAVTMQSAGGVKVLALGGLTKVEAIAAQVAGVLLMPGVLNTPTFAPAFMEPPYVDPASNTKWIAQKESEKSEQDARFVSHVASSAVDVAEVIIAECEKRRAVKQEPQQ